MTDGRARERIKWDCRRGLLELDVILQRFLDRYFDHLSAVEMDVFAELLAYEDNDLLDMVMGRAEPVNANLSAVLQKMRSA